MSKTIEVTVSLKGETTIQTKGFTGEACREAIRNGDQPKWDFGTLEVPLG